MEPSVSREAPRFFRRPRDGRSATTNVLRSASDVLFLLLRAAIMTTQKYREASRHLLVQARRELEAGDVRQASEKGWGAAAQMVKSIAEERGWLHRGHELLFDAVSTLAQEAGDEDIDRLFELASALHINFYEDWYGVGRVERGLRDVETFLDKLEAFAKK